MKQQFLSFLQSFWSWLTNRRLEVEHVGMAAVIMISTWHISQHMRVIEGSTVIAVVMGAVLGFLNAVFAMRFFEERHETRWPAGVGVLFFAIVSVWMQYGFYDENSDLQPYLWFDGRVNGNALMFGAWAPVSEILLGWLYGVRLFARGESAHLVDNIKAEYEKLLADLQSKFDRQLTVNQQLRDDIHALKTAGQRTGELIAQKDELITQLRSSITELRVENAALKATASTVNSAGHTPAQGHNVDRQMTIKLTPDERKAKIVEIVRDGRLVVDGEPREITISGLARVCGVVVNTIKSDLRALESAGLVTVNGSIAPGKETQ